MNHMKPIRINSDNAMAKLTEAIKEAEGRATARTITAHQVVAQLEAIEQHLGISKKAMIGVVVECDINAQKFPSAYRYTPDSTWFRAEYRASGWFVTSVDRLSTLQSDRRTTNITLTDEAKEAVIAKAMVF